MHMQLRCVPAASPPDVAKVLGVIAAAGVTLLSVGGSDVEFGGELALAPEHDQVDEALRALNDAGSKVRKLSAEDADSGLDLCWAVDAPGQLLECLSGISETNLGRGRIIRDILVGPASTETGHEGQIPVQIYSQEIRSSANAGGIAG